LVQIRWQWEQEWIQCCATPTEVFLSDGYHTQSFRPENESALMRWPNGLQAKVTKLSSISSTLHTEKRAILIPLEAGVEWEGQKLSASEALILPRKSEVRLKGDGVRVLVLSAVHHQV
jgi:hypothetical protein